MKMKCVFCYIACIWKKAIVGYEHICIFLKATESISCSCQASRSILYTAHPLGPAVLGESPGEEGDQEVLEPEAAVQGECSVPRTDHQLPAGRAGRQVLPEGQVAVHDSGRGTGHQEQH